VVGRVELYIGGGASASGIGIGSADRSGSAAAAPESGPVVQYLERRDPALKGYSKTHTAAREEWWRPPRAMERRMWPTKIKGGCEPWPGQPGRSDPTCQELDSCITSSRSKQIPAGGGEMGPCPKSSINRWRASITADRTMRKGSAQETRGLGQATAVSTVR